MFRRSTYLAQLIVCILCIGCSSGEYELRKVKVEYIEKQLVYDTIQTISYDTIKETIKDTIVEYQNNQVDESFYFIVQIGAFIDKQNFDIFYEDSRSKLGDAVYYEITNSLYKIRIGNYNNKADALKMLNTVISLGYSDAFIITVKK